MNDVAPFTRTGAVGTRVEVADPEAWFADPARRSELRALADAHLAVHVTLGGPLSAAGFSAMARTLGCPDDRFADFRAEPKEDDGRDRIPAWIESAHFDGESAYSLQLNISGQPLAANRFVDMAAVYRDLPPELRAQVTSALAIVGLLPPTTQPMTMAPPLDAERARRAPLVIAHPKTGEPVLRPPKSPLSLIEGMAEDEGRALLADLWARVEASPHAFEAELRPGQMLIWEGVAGSHTNPAFARANGRRSWFVTAPGPWDGFEAWAA